MLANIPHKQIEDLALVYRFSVGRDEHVSTLELIHQITVLLIWQAGHRVRN